MVYFFFVPLKLNNVFWNVPLKIVTKWNAFCLLKIMKCGDKFENWLY